MNREITQRDQEVLHHIITCEFRFGRMPTTKELCFILKMSHGQLSRHLGKLADAGKLLALVPGTIPYAIIDPTRPVAEFARVAG